MKTLKDLQLFAIISELPSYKAACQLYPESIVADLFELVCSAQKNVALQSAAMKIGLKLNPEGGVDAFEAGAAMLRGLSHIGLYTIKKNVKKMRLWIEPALTFDEKERTLLEPTKFESHEPSQTEGGLADNKDLILSKYSQHDKPLNYLFISKINKIPFKLDMDILLNFNGKNMPKNYNRVTAAYLGKNIYFNWKFDSRGRSYSDGYGLNIQGNKTVRSVLSFANEEVITDPEPLYVALANARGYDNWTWNARIAWAKKQTISHDVVLHPDTKYPEKYVKTIRAILDYEAGIPSGFPMELDATASGIQIMAAMTGCETTANEVNLLDSTCRKDVYATLARNMNTYDGVIVTRKEVKYPLMTKYYNSDDVPRQSFTEAEYEAFQTEANGMLPGAELFLKEINKCWNPRALNHSVTLPDGHVAHVNVMTGKEAKYSYEDVTVKYLYYVNKGNKTSFRSLSPNCAQAVDGYIARQMILRADFEMVHVHDCFLYHPNNNEAAKRIYREILASLVTDFNINHLIKGLTGKKSNIPVDASLADKILNSGYAIS